MSSSSDASRQSDSVSDDYRTDYAEAIALEAKAVLAVKQMARTHAAALRMLWSWNDGQGGGVLDMIAAEIGKPLPSEPPSLPPAKKKVISNALRKRVFERDAYRCVHCETHVDLSVDHIKPESKGGTLAFDNLQTLCRPCNSTKGAKE